MSRPGRPARAQALADYMVLVGVLVAVILAVSYGAYSGVLQDIVARIGSALDGVTGLLPWGRQGDAAAPWGRRRWRC